MTNQNFPAPDGQPEFICPESDTCHHRTFLCLHDKPHLLFPSCVDVTPVCPMCVIVDVVTIRDEKPLDDEK